MKEIHEGQCGLCLHFSEDHPQKKELLQIRRSKQAPEEFTDACGHPEHAHLNLVVTPISGCTGFEPAPAMQ